MSHREPGDYGYDQADENDAGMARYLPSPAAANPIPTYEEDPPTMNIADTVAVTLTAEEIVLVRKALLLWNDTVLCDKGNDLPDRDAQYRMLCRIDGVLQATQYDGTVTP